MNGSPRTTIKLSSSGGGVIQSTAAGLVAALVSAVIWMIVVQVTGYEVGIVAVGIGFLVGYAMAATAGTSRALAPIGAALALFGCVLGQTLTDAHFLAQAAGVDTITALQHMISNPDLGWRVFKAEFSPIDVLFWAIAGIQGYRLTAESVNAHRTGAPRPGGVPIADYLPKAATPVGPAGSAGPASPASPASPAGLASPAASAGSAGSDVPVAASESASGPVEAVAVPVESAATETETGPANRA